MSTLFFSLLLTNGKLTAHSYTSLDALHYQAYGHTLFAGGRFLAAFLGYFLRFKPRYMLLFLVVGAFITSALATFTNSTLALATLLLVFFFESAIFPTIFAMSLRGLGARTKLGSALLTMAISGGSVAPAIQYGVERGGKTVQYSLVVAVALFAFCGVLPVWVNVFPAARTQVDPLVEGEESTRVPLGVEKRINGLVRRKRESDLPTAEHVEAADRR